MKKCIFFPIEKREDLEHINLFFADDDIELDNIAHCENQFTHTPYVSIVYKKKTRQKQPIKQQVKI